MSSRPHILITNDDGVKAPGLAALAEALSRVGRVTVLAPQRNWSIAGHAKTLYKPLRVEETTLANGVPALATNGKPSDAVALALLGVVEPPIDLLVSGINSGPNLGHDVTYSGTVTAAMEGAIGGLPAIAISLQVEEGHHYETAAAFAARIAQLVLRHGIPAETLLNVNVPDLPADEVRGVQITRCGHRIYRDELVRRLDPQGRPYYWIGGLPPTGIAEEGTDIGAVAQGYISVTPLQLDLTAHALLGDLHTWDWEGWSN